MANLMGADMVELDVRLSADGAAVVHHDAVLTDGRAIADVAHTALPLFVPDLAAALDACRPMAVNIEIKNSATEPGYDPVARIAEVVAAVVFQGQIADRVLVSSFDEPTLLRLRTVAPDLATALLVVHPAAGDLERCVRNGFVALHPHHSAVDAALVTAAHRLGLAINTWTVDEPERMTELAALNIDGICTNVPDVLIETIRSSSPE